jgi:hypothetical protein
MDSDSIALAALYMGGTDGVLEVAGNDVTYRIAGRSIVAVVGIPPKVLEPEKTVVRLGAATGPNGPRLVALDAHHDAVAKHLTALLREYVSKGLTVTEGCERLKELDTPFQVEIVHG